MSCQHLLRKAFSHGCSNLATIERLQQELGLKQWSFNFLPVSIEKVLMEHFLRVPCNDDDAKEDEPYYTSFKWLSKKKQASATHLLTHY